MQHLRNFIFSLLKYFLFSSIASLILFVAMVSVTTGKFPPSWKLIKSFGKNIEAILALKNQMAVQNGQFNALPGIPAGTLPAGAIKGVGNAGASPSGGYNDPELADVNEVIRAHQKQAALSQVLAGEAHFGSSTPPSTPNDPNSDSGTSDASVAPALAERVRKLEDLVARMHGQLQTLNQEVARLRQQPH